jgi:hypothetical protein
VYTLTLRWLIESVCHEAVPLLARQLEGLEPLALERP